VNIKKKICQCDCQDEATLSRTRGRKGLCSWTLSTGLLPSSSPPPPSLPPAHCHCCASWPLSQEKQVRVSGSKVYGGGVLRAGREAAADPWNSTASPLAQGCGSPGWSSEMGRGRTSRLLGRSGGASCRFIDDIC
jgi:hypothetical protein